MPDTLLLSPQVKLSGSALATAWQDSLIELRVELALNVPGRVTLRFSDPGYALLAAGTVSLGATLVVLDPSGSTTIFTGAVTSIECDQREREQPELVVVAHDPSRKLGLVSLVKTWSTGTVSSIVGDLVNTAQLAPTVGSSISGTSMPYLLQVDTRLGLLGELAMRYGADWWVAGTTLYFGPPGDLSSARKNVSVTLGVDLRSFSGRATSSPSSVTVTGWDPKQQETVTGTASSASTGVVATSTLGGLATATGTFVTAAVAARSTDEATAISQALFDLRAGAAVEARGVAQGNAAMAPGGTVTVANAGPLSGTYPLTAVEHTWRPRRGFLTRFRSGDRRPAGLGSPGSSSGGRVTSVTGHPGVTAGIVTNIKDPTTTGRVKVRFPGMSSTQESSWARVVTAGGGSSRGNVFLPEVTDEVLVAFEDGDTRTPVVIGGLFGSKSSIPAPTLKNGKVAKRELVSRLGHVIRFLDGTETKTKAVEIALADGELIHFGEDKTTITVKSGNAMLIKVGETKITVAASTGALTLKAGTVKITATQKITLTAPEIAITAKATVTVVGKASATVTGAMTTVKASSMVAITGSPVSINSG